VNRKAVFLQNESIRITNRINSNRELECSNGYCRPLIGNPMLEVEPSGRRGHRKWLKRAGRSLSFRRHRGDILFHFNHLCNSLQSLIIHKNLKRFENKKIINLSRLGRHDSLAPLWVRHWLINNCRYASFHRGSAVCIAVSDVTFLSIDGLCKADKLARFSLPSLIFWVSRGGGFAALGSLCPAIIYTARGNEIIKLVACFSGRLQFICV